MGWSEWSEWRYVIEGGTRGNGGLNKMVIGVGKGGA